MTETHVGLCRQTTAPGNKWTTMLLLLLLHIRSCSLLRSYSSDAKHYRSWCTIFGNADWLTTSITYLNRSVLSLLSYASTTIWIRITKTDPLWCFQHCWKMTPVHGHFLRFVLRLICVPVNWVSRENLCVCDYVYCTGTVTVTGEG